MLFGGRSEAVRRATQGVTVQKVEENDQRGTERVCAGIPARGVWQAVRPALLFAARGGTACKGAGTHSALA